MHFGVKYTLSPKGQQCGGPVFSYFPFGFEGRIWDLIVSVPDHCSSFYFGHILVTISLEKNDSII